MELRLIRDHSVREYAGNCRAVQWVGFSASTVGHMGSTTGQGTKITQAIMQPKKKHVHILLNV